MKKLFLATLLIFTTMSSYGGAISDLFDDGVFSTKWGDSLSDVQKIHTNGKVKKYSGVTNYIVNDSRQVFGFDRNKKMKSIYSFDTNGKLHYVSVQFQKSDHSKLQLKLQTIFGKPKFSQNFGGAILDWEQDGDVSIKLMVLPSGFSSEITFNIQFHGLSIEDLNKESLGF